MIGYTAMDYEMSQKGEPLNEAIYWDNEKKMYVMTRDPETGEEIPTQQLEKPLTSPDPHPMKSNTGRNLLLAGLAVGAYFMLNR